MDQDAGQQQIPAQGQRMLAAIVFTDVVGFSTMAGIDESKALRLLERDTVVIKDISQRHGAIVVKSTGDGMLMCFASAVEAVQAAIEIQEALRVQNEPLASPEVLKHRLGVHLGDVVILPNDVVGDGVNIAARLQSEAKPGGIAISDAIYAVVRGKVSFKATNLGPRNLKHIVETVNVWMIPPHDEPVVVGKPIHPETRPGFVLEPQKEEGPGGMRLLAVILGIAICLAGLAFLINWMNAANRNAKPLEAKHRPVTEPTNESVAEKPGDTPANPDGTPNTSGTLGSPNTTASTGGNGTPIPSNPSEPPVDDEISKLASNYEFDTAADQLERRADGAAQGARIVRLRRLGEYRRWIEGGIAAATQTRPILVAGGGMDSDKDYELWTVNGAMSVRLQDGSVQPVTLQKLEPRELLRITAAIFKKEGASANEKANIIQRARDFAIEMRLGKLPDGLE